MLTRLKNFVRPFLLGVRRDAATGHLFYRIGDVRQFIRFREECVRQRNRRHVFDQVYFRDYLPGGTDTVVDIGAGLGTEIVMLAQRSPHLRYLAVEIQPWVYECLCLTLDQLPDGFIPVGVAIGEDPVTRIQPSRSGLDATTTLGGPVPVETLPWSVFATRHGLTTVDLLKMNVEGAEAELLAHIDLRPVARVIVNVHDFRADRGEGEHFRTRERVERRLAEAGFRITCVGPDWLFGRRD